MNHNEYLRDSCGVNNIAPTAPDVLGLVLAMLRNPLAGSGGAVKKIEEKAEEETKENEAETICHYLQKAG